MNVDQFFRFQIKSSNSSRPTRRKAPIHVKNGDDVSQKASWDAERRERQARGRLLLRSGSDLIPRWDTLIPRFVFRDLRPSTATKVRERAELIRLLTWGYRQRWLSADDGHSRPLAPRSIEVGNGHSSTRGVVLVAMGTTGSPNITCPSDPGRPFQPSRG